MLNTMRCHFIFIIIGSFFAVVRPVSAADLSASVSYTTDYTVLGISRSRGEPVFQGGITLAGREGFYASLWASQVTYGSAPVNPYVGYRDERDLELDIYVGYNHTFTPGWRGEIMLARYTYPAANSTRDWAYNEVSFALHFRRRFSVSLGFSQNLFGQNEVTPSIAGSTHLFSWRGLTGSAELGYVQAAVLPDGYWYGQLGLARHFGVVQAQLLWRSADNTARRYFGSVRTRPRLVVRLDVHF